MRKIILIILLSFLTSSLLNGQNLQFDQYTTETGLPSNRVYYVYKDSKNFIWICTDMGVARFNGIKFEQFSTLDGLADNDIFNCFEDKWGRIWFASYNGKLSYFHQGKFYNEKSKPWLEIKVPHGFIKSFKQNPQDSSFHIFVNNAGPILFEGEYNSLKKISYEKEFSHNPRLNHSSINLISHDTLYLRFPEKNISSALYTNGRLIYLAKNIGPASNVIIGNNGKSFLLQLDRNTFNITAGEYLPQLMDHNILYAFYEEGSTQLYGTLNGLIIMDGHNQKKFLPNRHITSITKDRFGTYYISTYNSGLYITETLLDFNTQFLDFSVTAFAGINKDHLWSDRIGNIYQKTATQTARIISHRETTSKLENDEIEMILAWDNNLVTKSKKNHFLYAKQSQKSTFFVKSGMSDMPLGKIKILPFRSELFAVHSFHLERINLTNFNDQTIIDVNKNSRLLSAAADDTISLWANTTNQFFEIRKGKAIEKKHLSKLNIEIFDFLNHRLVMLDNDNKLWIIDKYDDPESLTKREPKARTKFKALKKINKHSIICRDKKNDNWLLSINNGQFLFQELTELLKHAELDNIFSDQKAVFLNSDNRLLRISNEHITAPKWQPIVRLKNITKNDNTINITDRDVITLNLNDRITFNYQSLSKYSNSINYEYALTRNNSDTIWNQVKEPSVTITVSSREKCTVLFRVRNNNDQLSNIIARSFTVPQPFYYKWWFITLAIVGLGSIVLIILLMFRLSKQRKIIHEKEQEKKIIQSEFKSLNTLMNPHFIFNSLNNIHGFINSGANDEANKYLLIFSELVRQNIHNINEGKISLQKEMNLVKNYLLLEKMRFNERFEYEIIIDKNVEIDAVFVPPLSIQPIVENCIKHGILPLENKFGRVQVLIKQYGSEMVEVTVQDNGVGFDNSNKTAGNKTALKNIKKRFLMLSKIHDKEYQFQIRELGEFNQFRNTVVIHIPFLD